MYCCGKGNAINDERHGRGAGEGGHGHFGPPEVASFSIHAIIEAKYAIVEHLLESPAARGLSKAAGAVTIAVIETVDVVGAIMHGTAQDVAVQSAGVGGTVGGALIGAELGAIAGEAVTPVGAAIVGVIGGVAGAMLGEDKMEELANALLSPSPYTGPPQTVAEELKDQFPNVPLSDIEHMVKDAKEKIQNRDPWNQLEINFWDEIEYTDILDRLAEENSRNGPYAGAPGRPGPLNHSHSLPELAGTGYIGPQNGNPITSRGVDAPEGPEAFGGGNDHDHGDNRSNGTSGGHVPGSQHPGNTNGTGHSGSHGGRGGFTPSAGGGHGDTSSFGGNSGRDTPPGDVSTHTVLLWLTSKHYRTKARL